MHILVVDDSPVMRRIIMQALAKGGMTDVSEAGDGVDAVAACSTREVNLVLMDWNMPNMKGIDALREIRRLGFTMPVIMVTTEAEKTRVLEAIKAGAVNYVVKPFAPETLLAQVAKVVEN